MSSKKSAIRSNCKNSQREVSFVRTYVSYIWKYTQGLVLWAGQGLVLCSLKVRDLNCLTENSEMEGPIKRECLRKTSNIPNQRETDPEMAMRAGSQLVVRIWKNHSWRKLHIIGDVGSQETNSAGDYQYIALQVVGIISQHTSTRRFLYVRSIS